jgi:hypothetical protein
MRKKALLFLAGCVIADLNWMQFFKRWQQYEQRPHENSVLNAEIGSRQKCLFTSGHFLFLRTGFAKS